jgi:signal transduction histidine kinase
MRFIIFIYIFIITSESNANLLITANLNGQSTLFFNNVSKNNNSSKNESTYNKAISLLDEYKLDESEKLFNESLKIFQATNNLEYIGHCYHNLGIISEIRSEFNEAIEYYNKAINAYQIIDYKQGLANSYNNLGIIYCINEQYENGLEYYLKSLELEEQTNNLEGISYSYGNIGLVYRKIGNIEKAIEYYNKSLELKRKLNDKHGMAITYGNLGSLYTKIDSIKKALILFDLSYELNLETNNQEGQAYALHNIGDAYILNGNYNEAISYFQKSLQIRESLGDEKGMTSSLYSLAEANYYLKRYNLFHYAIDSSYSLAKKLNQNDFILKTLFLYYEYNLAINNNVEALRYLQEYTEKKLKIDEDARTEQILEMQARFDTEKKELEIKEKDSRISRLEKEKEIQKLKIKNDRLLKLFLVSILILIITIAFIVYKRYKLKTKINLILKEKNIELEEANATKNKFFSIISHDLSNYASLIESVSGMIERKHKMMTPEILENNLVTLNNSANKNKQLIKSLLEWAIAQSKKITLEPKYIDVTEFCLDVISSLENIAKEKNIELQLIIKENFNFYADRNTTETVLRNLISNAIKFSHNKSIIEIIANTINDKAEFIVKDYGIGIKEEDIQKLFRVDVNTKSIGNSPNKGTGFGLILCKEFIKINAGTIQAYSEINKSTEFRFYLPLKPIKDE